MSVPILLIFATVLSLLFITMPAYSGGGISHPHGTIIEVAPGENFLLRYRLYWNEPGYDGMFSITLVWYNYDNKPGENLTFLSARAYWDNGENLQMDVTCDPSPSGANTMWMLGLDSSSYPSPHDDNFTVDIWMRAAGAGNVPHSLTDNHPILGPGGFKAVSVAESGIIDIDDTEKPITIRVRPPSPPPIPYPVIAGVAIGAGAVVVIALLLKRRMLHSRVRFLTCRPTPFKAPKAHKNPANPKTWIMVLI